MLGVIDEISLGAHWLQAWLCWLSLTRTFCGSAFAGLALRGSLSKNCGSSFAGLALLGVVDKQLRGSSFAGLALLGAIDKKLCGSSFAGLALLGVIDEKFVEVSDLYEPLSDGKQDRCFISRGYDASSHFETTANDVLDMYQRIQGHPLDLSEKDPNKTVTT